MPCIINEQEGSLKSLIRSFLLKFHSLLENLLEANNRSYMKLESRMDYHFLIAWLCRVCPERFAVLVEAIVIKASWRFCEAVNVSVKVLPQAAQVPSGDDQAVDCWTAAYDPVEMKLRLTSLPFSAFAYTLRQST
jgi:hypothetical protein